MPCFQAAFLSFLEVVVKSPVSRRISGSFLSKADLARIIGALLPWREMEVDKGFNLEELLGENARFDMKEFGLCICDNDIDDGERAREAFLPLGETTPIWTCSIKAVICSQMFSQATPR
jgi:hypothetical protein